MNTQIDQLLMKTKVFLMTLTSILILCVSAVAYGSNNNFSFDVGAPENLVDLLNEKPSEQPAVENTQTSAVEPLVIVDKPETVSIFDKKLKKNESTFLPKIVTEVPTSSWLRSGLAFLFVASLILVLAGFFNKKLKLGGGKRLLRKALPTLSLEHTLSLGVKKQISVVNFEGTRLVIGVTQQQMSILYVDHSDELSQPTKVREVSRETSQQSALSFEETFQEQESVQEPRQTRTRKPMSQKIREKIQNMRPISNEGNKYMCDETPTQPVQKNLNDFARHEAPAPEVSQRQADVEAFMKIKNQVKEMKPKWQSMSMKQKWPEIEYSRSEGFVSANHKS